MTEAGNKNASMARERARKLILKYPEAIIVDLLFDLAFFCRMVLVDFLYLGFFRKCLQDERHLRNIIALSDEQLDGYVVSIIRVHASNWAQAFVILVVGWPVWALLLINNGVRNFKTAAWSGSLASWYKFGPRSHFPPSVRPFCRPFPNWNTWFIRGPPFWENTHL